MDAIPDFIKNSGLFSGNDLGLLANVAALPSPEEVVIFVKENFAQTIYRTGRAMINRQFGLLAPFIDVETIAQ